MKRFFLNVSLAILIILLVAACGRKFPDEPIPVTASSTSVPATEVVTQEVIEEETEAVLITTEEPSEEIEATAEATQEIEAESDDIFAAALAAGDPANGQTIFNASYTTSAGPWICASCHSVTEDQLRLVGPGLYGIADRSTERSAESGDTDGVAYIHSSIVNPAAYHVVGDPAYPENLMPPNYGEIFSEQEVNDLVAYLISLNS